jgi:L-ascorbate metabolism protein UlaG (beta-lactamase superfamily)
MGSAALTGTAFLPFQLKAAGHSSGDIVITDRGTVTIYPVGHASFAMETDWGTVYVDPVGEAQAYENIPEPNLILVTHEHGDHYSEDVLLALSNGVPIGVNQATYDKFSDTLKERATVITHDQTATFRDFTIDAIPAYNITEDRLNFHPRDRGDNGYVVTLPGGFRMYASGDTEDIPEMRALENIDVAFVCMNLPFTMDAEAAASAVNEFAPRVCYPYHYRGRDDGTQDPTEFAQMVSEATKTHLGNWY